MTKKNDLRMSLGVPERAKQSRMICRGRLRLLPAVLILACLAACAHAGGNPLGSFTPRLTVHGQTYYWESVPQIDAVPSSYVCAGTLTWTREETEAPEELELSADVEVSGRAYCSEATPDVVYVTATTGWLTDEWVRFVVPIMNHQACIGYGNALYTVPAGEESAGLDALPTGFVPAGRLAACAPDTLPAEDLTVTWERFAGRSLYTSKDDPETVYMEAVRTSASGDKTVFIPCPKSVEQEPQGQSAG